MVYLPKENGKSRKISFIFMVAAVLLWMLSGLQFKFYAIFQIIAIAFMVVGLQILIRFVMSDFRYVVEFDDDGEGDLLIFKSQGNREVKVCHVALSKVTAVFKLTDKPNFQEEYGKTANRFNYCRNMGKENQWILLFRDGEKLIEVRFEPNREMFELIEKEIGGENSNGRGFVM